MNQLRTLILLLLFLNVVTSCASTPQSSKTMGGEDELPLFEVPRHWEIVDEKDGDTLYQANLRNNGGAGRMLIGRLRLKADVGQTESYLFGLHRDLVKRIQGEIALEPFAEQRLAWANGIVGYRTKMRGELGRRVVIIEGITFTDRTNAYFHYGLFEESGYQADRLAYAEVLASLGPLRGTQRLANQGMEIGGAAPVSSEIGSDGSTKPADYPSLATHLGMAEWGSSRDEIERSAGQPLRSGDSAVGYRCQFMGIDNCVVIYLFEYGKLTHGGFLLESKFEDPQEYVVRYLKLTKLLSDVLGAPRQSAAIWSNPELREQGARWGEALARQQVVFGSVWEVGPTKVVHSLQRDDQGNVQHRILVSNDELRGQPQAAP